MHQIKDRDVSRSQEVTRRTLVVAASCEMRWLIDWRSVSPGLQGHRCQRVWGWRFNIAFCCRRSRFSMGCKIKEACSEPFYTCGTSASEVKWFVVSTKEININSRWKFETSMIPSGFYQRSREVKSDRLDKSFKVTQSLLRPFVVAVKRSKMSDTVSQGVMVEWVLSSQCFSVSGSPQKSDTQNPT